MPTPDFIKAPVALVNNLVMPHPKAKAVDMAGKVVLVTGATPGSIGFETVLALKAWGAKIIATVRSEESRIACKKQIDNKLGKNDIDVQCMDLESADSVRNFSDYVKCNYERLNVLINNAGIFLDMAGNWAEEKLSLDGEEIHWRVNYLGVVQLTLSLLPLLEKTAKETGEARVLFITSHMHDNCVNEEMFSGLKPYKSVKAYGRSKLALMHLVLHLHKILNEKTAIKFVSVHPGSVYTNLADKGFGENPLINRLRKIFSLLERMILLSPEEGAQTQIMCATDAVVESGLYYRRCQVDTCSPELEDEKASALLWQQTLEFFDGRGLRLI